MARSPASLIDQLKSWPLALLPHGPLSHLVRRITRWQVPWLKSIAIRLFIRAFNVDMSESRQAEEAFPDFNSFFTRALKPGCRNQPEDLSLVTSPVDGSVSECGRIQAGRLLQAKGHDYSLEQLLGDSDAAGEFANGRFATLYLSPRDYHRIHMPCDARLRETRYIPGRLYSVAPHTTRAIPGLFTRNERLSCLFDTEHGPMALVMVGAIFVSCMETTWAGVVNPRCCMQAKHHDYRDAGPAINFRRGDEMGRFNMGSTVILVFADDSIEWEQALGPGKTVRVGNIIGRPSC